MLNATDKTFDKLVSDGVVLVDFWAEWCGPCKAIAPALDKIEKKYKSKLKIVKVDVDACKRTSDEYEIRSIPTLLIFRDGAVVGQLVGAVSQAKIEAALTKVLP